MEKRQILWQLFVELVYRRKTVFEFRRLVQLIIYAFRWFRHAVHVRDLLLLHRPHYLALCQEINDQDCNMVGYRMNEELTVSQEFRRRLFDTQSGLFVYCHPMMIATLRHNPEKLFLLSIPNKRYHHLIYLPLTRIAQYLAVSIHTFFYLQVNNRILSERKKVAAW